MLASVCGSLGDSDLWNKQSYVNIKVANKQKQKLAVVNRHQIKTCYTLKNKK